MKASTSHQGNATHPWAGSLQEWLEPRCSTHCLCSSMWLQGISCGQG